MKRILTWMLVMLLLTGTAHAAEWHEGTGPSKPYTSVPEINLDEKMGYMVFSPSTDLRIQNACQRLYIYLPREDVQAGNGILYLCTDANRKLWNTPMNSEAVTQRAMSETELTNLLWGGGTCFEVVLPRTLELGQTYYVNLERGCIISDSGVENPQIGETDAWRFTLEGDYGVSAMEYRRPLANGRYEDSVLIPQGGDEIRFDLTLGGDAAMAIVYGDASVDFLTVMYTESGEVTGMVNTDHPSWGVMFLDAQGNEIGLVDFR